MLLNLSELERDRIIGWRLCSSQDGDMLVQKYYEVPILKYIEPITFVEKLLSMNSEDQRHVFWAINERYEFQNINAKLIEELKWLKDVQSLLQVEVGNRKGKVSGFVLDLLIKHYINEAVEKLEMKGPQTQVSQ